MCTQRVHLARILTVVLVGFFLFSCTPDESKRPSPLTGDSLRTADNFLYILYSSPAVRGRKIWGELDPYGKVWRIGANEATIFYTEKDILIDDSLLLPTGKYALFAIPRPDAWTIIFNRDWDQWGAYDYDEARDQLRFDLTPKMVGELKERLTFEIRENELWFHWEYLTFSIPYSTK